MKLTSKFFLTTAAVTVLFGLDAWIDDRDAARHVAALRQRNTEIQSDTARARLLLRDLDRVEATLTAPSERHATEIRALLVEMAKESATLAGPGTPLPIAGPAGTLASRLRVLGIETGRWLESPAGDPAPVLTSLRAAESALADYLLALHRARNADDQAEIALLEQQRSFNLGLLALVIAGLGGLLWFWHRELIQPLRRLEEDARKVRAGLRSGVRLGYRRDDELGAVAHAFNESLDALQSTAYSRAELERLVAERSVQLREREALLQRVIDGSGQGYWDWNIRTGQVTFSGSWARMLGYELDEIEHSLATWERLLHPDDRGRAIEAVEAHIHGTSPTYEVEFRLRTKDGAWRWVLTRGLIVERDADGRAIHLSGTHTDIHDRKLAELALRQREEQLRLVSDNFPEGALYQFVVGADGVPRNTYIGDGFRRILGIDLSEPLANWRWIEQHVHPDDLPELRVRHLHAIERKESFHHVIRVRTSQGELKWLSFRSHPRDGGEGRTIWDGVMIDVTRLKQAETQLAQQADFHAALNATWVDLLNRRGRDDLLQAIVERTAFLLAVPHVELALIEGDELVTRAYAGKDEGVLGDRATRAQAPLSWRAVDTLQPSVTEDYQHMPGARALYRDQGMRAAAVFPVLLGNSCLGILGLGRQNGTPFTLGDLQKGQLLAQVVALVLHNATIYEDAVRVAESRMQALRESETRLREAQRIAHLGHWEYHFTPGNTLELWSDETYRIFGLEPQSVPIDRTRFDSFIHPEDLPRIRTAIAESFARRGKAELRYRIVRPDGSIREIADSSEPKRDASGTVIGMQGIIQDVTEQAAAEASLRASELRFKRVVENIGDALMMDDEEGRIVYANERFLEMFRLRAEDLPGRTIFDHVLPEQREATRAMHRSRLAGLAAPSLLEIEALRADGSRFWAELRITPVIEAGRIIGSQAALRDITQQRQAEARLRHAQKMESLGTLAGGIAHDFNNILTGMFGFIELARADLPAGDPTRQWLDNIAAAGQRAKDLVKQILTFSRQHEGERVAVDLSAVVAEALRLLRSTLPPMVRIEAELAGDLPAVLADSTQLHQVIMNLGTNAWHALPESGGTLRVRTEALHIGEELVQRHPDLPRGEALRITVADDGCGIPPEVLERIFEPFFTTKTAGRGTGLGLAVVHGVVRSHGGGIVVRSQPGRGTTFEIYLPALQRRAELTPVQLNLPYGQGERLLLVDDDNVGREAMAALLRHIGYVVDDFEHPQVAFTRFATQPSAYAVVLTDFAMPLVTGAEFTRQVRGVRPEVPVLLVTGYVDPRQQSVIQDLGLNGVVRKPPTIEELAQAVHDCLPRAAEV